MPHFPTFPPAGARLIPPPVDPDRARLEALRRDLAAADAGRFNPTRAALAVMHQEIARLERAIGEAR